jgi:hypothetical protein
MATDQRNSFIELKLNAMKRNPEYSGCFRDLEEAVYDCTECYEEHEHSGSYCVMPLKGHMDLRNQIITQ